MTAKNALVVPVRGNPVRVTLFLAGPGATVAESHYYATDGDINSAMSQGLLLAAKRVALLGSDARGVELRASLENVFRDSLAADLSSLKGPPGNGACDPKDRCLNVRVECGSLYRKNLFLALIPDNTIQKSKYAPAGVAGWHSALDSYLFQLTGFANVQRQVWGTLVINKDQGFTPRVPIVRTGFNLDLTRLDVLTRGVHGLKVGDVVRLRTVLGKGVVYPFSQRVFKVVAVQTPTQFDLALSSGAHGQAPQVGTIQRQVRVFAPYSDYFLRGIGFRKRGGRTMLPRGSRRSGRHTP